MSGEVKDFLITLDQLDTDYIGSRVSWVIPGTDQYVVGTLQDYAVLPRAIYLYIWGKDNRMHVEKTTNPTHTLMVSP